MVPNPKWKRRQPGRHWKVAYGPIMSCCDDLRCMQPQHSDAVTLSRCPRNGGKPFRDPSTCTHTHTYPVQPVHPTKSFVSVKFNFREVFCLVAVYSLAIFFSTSATAEVPNLEAQGMLPCLPRPHSLVVDSGI